MTLCGRNNEVRVTMNQFEVTINCRIRMKESLSLSLDCSGMRWTYEIE